MKHLPAVAVALGAASLAALLIVHGHPMGGALLFLVGCLIAMGVEF